MTRPYALRQLLKLGPLLFSEIWTITGWTREQVTETIDALKADQSIVTVCDNFRFNVRYALVQKS